MADEKIIALRKWMRTQKIDAYLLPHADRFQSEYLQPGDERLAWATGFTGSAGMALIALEKAVLFTDGRYVLQASLQVDPAVFDIVESPPANPMGWMQQHLKSDAVIGFDPWLFTTAQMAHWMRQGAAMNWEFIPLEENPVDLLWQDKPKETIVQAEDQPLAFSGQSTADKIDAILQRRHKDAQHLLISEPALVCWLLNMRGRDIAHTPLVQSIALLDHDGQVTLLTDPQKITPELKKIWGNHVGVETLDNLYGVLKKIKGKLQIDPVQCPFAVKEFCLENKIKLIEASDPAILLRSCKNTTEIAGAVKAHDKDLIAYQDFLTWFQARDFANEQITERDVVTQLSEARRKTGALDDSFDTIAGYGPNGAIVHYHATEESNATLKPGSLLLLDSGGQYREGTTDVTRVLPVGMPTAPMKTHYTAVLQGLIRLSRARFPVGTTGGQLDALAREPIWAIGLDYAHGTGHGVGSFLSVHEGPVRFRADNFTVPLQPGMILSIEPGIYLQGQYGIRLENLVTVVEDKRPGDVKDMLMFQALTKLPFEAGLIDWAQLSAEEIIWLQGFNTEQS